MKERIIQILGQLNDLKRQSKRDDLRPEIVERNRIIQTMLLKELKRITNKNEIIKQQHPHQTFTGEDVEADANSLRRRKERR